MDPPAASTAGWLAGWLVCWLAGWRAEPGAGAGGRRGGLRHARRRPPAARRAPRARAAAARREAGPAGGTAARRRREGACRSASSPRAPLAVMLRQCCRGLSDLSIYYHLGSARPHPLFAPASRPARGARAAACVVWTWHRIQPGATYRRPGAAWRDRAVSGGALCRRHHRQAGWMDGCACTVGSRGAPRDLWGGAAPCRRPQQRALAAPASARLRHGRPAAIGGARRRPL